MIQMIKKNFKFKLRTWMMKRMRGKVEILGINQNQAIKYQIPGLKAIIQDDDDDYGMILVFTYIYMFRELTIF